MQLTSRTWQQNRTCDNSDVNPSTILNFTSNGPTPLKTGEAEKSSQKCHCV
ncbi:MAG: hypothetical protein JNL11_00195 [Bdellovibrionaceae bacterium]|nr:hypothetical protein [Pseudobdellovibrionaceae bacterium]